MGGQSSRSAKQPWHGLSLWPQQVGALQVVGRYLEARNRKKDVAALIRMPTGSGKSGVIAVVAHYLAGSGDVLLVTPWDILVEQLILDTKSRFWSTIGAEAPCGRPVVRLLPSLAAAQLTNEPSPTVWATTFAGLKQLHTRAPKVFGDLSSRLRLVMVDEGHYEPALSWSVTVRALKCPTVLFTATPYRNDFKFFDIDDSAVFHYSHRRAEEEGYLRKVRFQQLTFSSASEFCRQLIDAVGKRLSNSAKVIVRCDSRETVELITASLIQQGQQAVGIHEGFPAARPKGVLRRTVPKPGEVDARYWVHQFKLTEGIDDPAFQLVAFFRPFSSDRALVQQVGRILRNPRRSSTSTAWILHSPDDGLETSWKAYRQYDLATENQSTPTVTAPESGATQYLAGRFRMPLLLGDAKVHERFNYPLTTRALIASEDMDLDEIAEVVGRGLRSVDAYSVGYCTPTSDVRLHPYVVGRNSPLLHDAAFLEYRLGFTFYRRIGPYLMFHDTSGFAPEEIAKLPAAPAHELKRLYARPLSNLTSVSLTNTDLGDNASRHRSVQARSVSTLGPDLSDHAHIPSVARGQAAIASGEGTLTNQRYVGFTSGRVRDSGSSTFGAYMRWLDGVASQLSGDNAKVLDVFDRYAEFVEPPDEPHAVNILLDLNPTMFHHRLNGQHSPLQFEDLCLPVQSGRFTLRANEIDYEVSIRWDSDTSRYQLTSPELQTQFALNDDLLGHGASNLIGYLNREQAFRVIVSSGHTYLVYIAGRFCQPALHSGAGKQPDILQILEPVEELASITSEKGNKVADNGTGWQKKTLFHLIDSLGTGTALAKDLKKATLLVCDDLGTEIADFLAVIEATNTIIAIHAKAFSKPKKRSATAFHEITSQAVKNLGYLHPYQTRNPPNLDSWSSAWNGGTEVGKVSRRIRIGQQTTGNKAWKEMRGVLSDPSASRQVWLVLGGGLSKAELERSLRSNTTKPEIIQIIYLLRATWAAVSAIGGKLRVFCSP